jgi:hypothetical protein
MKSIMFNEQNKDSFGFNYLVHQLHWQIFRYLFCMLPHVNCPHSFEFVLSHLEQRETPSSGTCRQMVQWCNKEKESKTVASSK